VLEDMLEHSINPKQNNWDGLLAPTEFAINNAFPASIQDTPFYFKDGRHARLPTDLNLGKDKVGSAKNSRFRTHSVHTPFDRAGTGCHMFRD